MVVPMYLLGCSLSVLGAVESLEVQSPGGLLGEASMRARRILWQEGQEQQADERLDVLLDKTDPRRAWEKQ